MPYVTTERATGSRLSQGFNPIDSKAGSVDSTTGYEVTYSWRTGSRVSSAKLLPEPGSEGNLSERLMARKRVIERTLDELELGTQGNSAFRLTRDMGHDFGNWKFNTFSTPNSCKYHFSGDNASKDQSFTNIVPGRAVRVNNAGAVNFDAPYFQDIEGFFSSRGATLPRPDTNNSTNNLGHRGYSTKLIASMNPYASQASFLATAAELLRGDVPKVLGNLRRHYIQISRWKERYKNYENAARYIGQQSLNVQFGWAPIIRDVAAGVELLLNVDRALFPSDSTRRRRSIPIFQQTLNGTVAMPWSPGISLKRGQAGGMNFGPGLFSNSKDYVRSTYTNATIDTDWSVYSTANIQLTAKFRTGLAPNAVSNGYVDRGLDLLGLKLTPEVLWELTPWSWLIDWFSNMGTIISNVSTLGASNAILNYAYSTLRYKSSVTYKGRPVNGASSGMIQPKGSFHFMEDIDSKVRIAASPFGFSILTGALTGTQWGILSSLGLARMK